MANNSVNVGVLSNALAAAIQKAASSGQSQSCTSSANKWWSLCQRKSSLHSRIYSDRSVTHACWSIATVHVHMVVSHSYIYRCNKTTIGYGLQQMTIPCDNFIVDRTFSYVTIKGQNCYRPKVVCFQSVVALAIELRCSHNKRNGHLLQAIAC